MRLNLSWMLELGIYVQPFSLMIVRQRSLISLPMLVGAESCVNLLPKLILRSRTITSQVKLVLVTMCIVGGAMSVVSGRIQIHKL